MRAEPPAAGHMSPGDIWVIFKLCSLEFSRLTKNANYLIFGWVNFSLSCLLVFNDGPLLKKYLCSFEQCKGPVAFFSTIFHLFVANSYRLDRVGQTRTNRTSGGFIQVQCGGYEKFAPPAPSSLIEYHFSFICKWRV